MPLQRTVPPQGKVNGTPLDGPGGFCDGCAKCPGHAYTQPVLTAFRGRIYRLLAFCVFVLTLGRVQVNATGRATVDGPGRDDTNASAEEGTR